MSYKRILTIQDISCVGQCSLTVALPILSACGLETAVLPSAVLSTHTGGFSGYTFRDLTDDIPAIAAHWQKENIKFDAIYSGYLGSVAQIEMVKNIMQTAGKDGYLKIVDPAMADNGKLYPAFNGEYVKYMAELCGTADIVIPNITEASFLVGEQYREIYGDDYIKVLCEKLVQLGAKMVVLTGVSYKEGCTGVAVWEKGDLRYYEHEKLPKGCHGTGDVFASAFAGALLNGKDAYTAAKIAADFTLNCIKVTQSDADHWYGVKFEVCLPQLFKDLQ